MRFFRVGCFLALGVLAAGRLPADPASVPASRLAPDTVLRPVVPPSAGPAAPAGGLGGTATATLVVLVGAAAGWILWRRVRAAGPPAKGGRLLSVSETRSLGNRQFLVVAAYGERRFLLGVCPGRIDLLAPLDGGPAQPSPEV